MAGHGEYFVQRYKEKGWNVVRRKLLGINLVQLGALLG